jgi:tetratricopeptide (TPR) repeat protein
MSKGEGDPYGDRGKGDFMRQWNAGKLCLLAAVALAAAGLAGVGAWAQEDEAAAKANTLWNQGRRLDALPLYEDLATAHPNEWMYQERLAVALEVKADHTSDPAEVKTLRTRQRDAAKRAVEAGDPNYFMQMMTKIDPDAPLVYAPGSPAANLQGEAEKAYGIGDYKTALAKYAEAAEVDPKLYDAPLYAGDTAYLQKDLPTAAKWFARAIQVNPNRETAYRYWGDALLRIGGDADAAKPKYIDAIVAEPYSKLAWQGLQSWAQRQKAVLLPPKIQRPSSPVIDPKNPKNITINIDPTVTDEKKNPGASAWMMYSIVRAGYHGDRFAKDFPNEKEYRHTLKEEDDALSLVATTVKEKKIKPEKLDESLRNLVELNDAGMLDCWILINAADNGIAQDYEAYRNEHRELLRDYLQRFVVHGGLNPTE